MTSTPLGLLAAERHAEVMDAVAGARDPDHACRSVADLLGITEDAARGVLDLRLMRFSQREVAGTRGERDDKRASGSGRLTCASVLT